MRKRAPVLVSQGRGEQQGGGPEQASGARTEREQAEGQGEEERSEGAGEAIAEGQFPGHLSG